MRVAVTGATGTIGRALVAALRERGDDVTALSRDDRRAQEILGVNSEEWKDPKSEPAPADALRGRDAVVHLLGEQIAQRWSDEAKREIRDSRVLSTRNLVSGLAELPESERPRVLVSQSGAGWYGHRGDERLDESGPVGDDFLAQLSADWEAEARRAEELGVRVVVNRTGMVLSETGGALEKMLPFFKAGIGGPVAGGRQYVPWVHLDDVVGAILFELDTEAAAGPVNLTAPEPATNRELSKALGRALRRPAVAPVPALAVKALYGQMAEIVTTGQRAVPARLTELGYRFRQPDLEEALRDATGSRRAGS
jgi:uncharacterized protein (TIGR01777 family)